MVFLPSTAVMSAEEAANVIKVDECDRYDGKPFIIYPINVILVNLS